MAILSFLNTLRVLLSEAGLMKETKRAAKRLRHVDAEMRMALLDFENKFLRSDTDFPPDFAVPPALQGPIV